MAYAASGNIHPLPSIVVAGGGDSDLDKADDIPIFITSSGARFRCALSKVEHLFCSQTDNENPHIMSGTKRVLTERFTTIGEQGGTYIVITDEGLYADLHCLKKNGILPMNQFPVPVGAFQKNLDYERIEVACANMVNERECGASLPLGHLPEHLSSEACHCSSEDSGNLSGEGESSDSDLAGNDDKRIHGLLSDDEKYQLNQMLASLSLETPENDMAIISEMATCCDGPASSFNGILEWQISDFQRKKQLAESGERPMLASPPFYTKTGYKMCAKAYLAGHSSAKQFGGLSLAVAILKSDDDDKLPWPFREKVTITLLNQSGGNGSDNYTGHVVGSASGYEKENTCHQKPITAMNDLIGHPDFLAPGELDDRFVKDDCIVIQVKVEPPEPRKIHRAKRRLAKTRGELTK